MNGNFFTISRSIWSHWVSQREDYLCAWIWMISEASWKDGKKDLVNGKLIQTDRGQLVCSVRFLMKARKWRSTDKATRFFEMLEKDGMIVRKTVQGETVVTICNYDSYQQSPNTERTATGTPSGQGADRERTGSGQGADETNKDNNLNKDNKDNKVVVEGSDSDFQKLKKEENTICEPMEFREGSAFENLAEQFPKIDVRESWQNYEEWWWNRMPKDQRENYTSTWNHLLRFRKWLKGDQDRAQTVTSSGELSEYEKIKLLNENPLADVG